jgi:hypothetical protein
MTHALVRTLPAPRASAVLACLAVLAAFASAATGFGASSSSQNATANVLATISLTDPSAKAADPPVCTDALAPLDTDNCADTTFTPGASQVLRLGALSGSDVQAGSLSWSVTTTSPTGYRVYLSNAGAAPFLRGTAGSIPDMQTAPLVPASAVDDATHFGVALGDAASDNQAAVDFPGSPWVTATSQPGELFSGITTSAMKIAERTTPQSNDPFTLTFAAASIASQPPAPGSYAGTANLVASVI